MSTTITKTHTPTPTRRPLPKGWRQVVGILKGRRKNLEDHVKKMRNEWDRPLRPRT